MDLFELVGVLKVQYELEIEAKKNEIQHLSNKLEVLEDLSALMYTEKVETVTEPTEIGVEDEENHGDDTQDLDGSY